MQHTPTSLIKEKQIGKINVAVIEDILQMYHIYSLCLKENFNLIHMQSIYDVFKSKNENIQAFILDYNFGWDQSFDDILTYIKFHYKNVVTLLISGHTEILNLNQKYKGKIDSILSKPLDNYQSLNEHILNLIHRKKEGQLN